jgi:two-component system OmpR family sensor kinase
VEIRDNVSGITPAFLPKIFDRFFRAAPTDAEGSGLGVTLAKAAARRNRANLTPENRPAGQGLLMRIHLGATLAS